jgi:hypothetical protein
MRFFVDKRKASGGIRLTPEMHRLRDDIQPRNLGGEVEARWALVEHAWALRLPAKLRAVDYEPHGELIVPNRGAAPDLQPGGLASVASPKPSGAPHES